MSLVTGIDHLYATAPDASRLFRLFRDELGSPTVWPYQSWGAFSSGGVSLGNAVLELTQWTSRWRRALPLEFAGIALEPTGSTTAAIAEPSTPAAPDEISFRRGPRMRVVASRRSGIRGIVVAVRSLDVARAVLRQQGALAQSTSGRVQLGASLVGTLRVELVAEG